MLMLRVGTIERVLIIVMHMVSVIAGRLANVINTCVGRIIIQLGIIIIAVAAFMMPVNVIVFGLGIFKAG